MITNTINSLEDIRDANIPIELKIDSLYRIGNWLIDNEHSMADTYIRNILRFVNESTIRD